MPPLTCRSYRRDRIWLRKMPRVPVGVDNPIGLDSGGFVIGSGAPESRGSE